MTTEQIPFALGMASISGSPQFPLVLLDDEAAISVEALAPLSAKLGHGLTGLDSVHGLLQDWSRNLPGLTAAVRALDDAELGKYVRSSVTALEFFDLHAPVSPPLQVFVAGEETVMQPATTLAGPQAKVPIPYGADTLGAGLAAAVIIGAPTYRATIDEALAAIAGYSVATRYATQNGETWSPAFLPIGPFLLPAQFANASVEGRISFNGEAGEDATFDPKTAAESIRAISARAQLFPGDIVVCPLMPINDAELGDGDLVESAIAGLGRQTTNIMKESKNAYRGN